MRAHAGRRKFQAAAVLPRCHASAFPGAITASIYFLAAAIAILCFFELKHLHDYYIGHLPEVSLL